MANHDHIRNRLKELSKVLGTVFYVTNQLKHFPPEYYPLWVATHYGISLIEEIETLIDSEGFDAKIH